MCVFFVVVVVLGGGGGEGAGKTIFISSPRTIVFHLEKERVRV